jgi:hypothetical protein
MDIAGNVGALKCKGNENYKYYTWTENVKKYKKTRKMKLKLQ